MLHAMRPLVKRLHVGGTLRQYTTRSRRIADAITKDHAVAKIISTAPFRAVGLQLEFMDPCGTAVTSGAKPSTLTIADP